MAPPIGHQENNRIKNILSDCESELKQIAQLKAGEHKNNLAMRDLLDSAERIINRMMMEIKKTNSLQGGEEGFLNEIHKVITTPLEITEDELNFIQTKTQDWDNRQTWVCG